MLQQQCLTRQSLICFCIMGLVACTSKPTVTRPIISVPVATIRVPSLINTAWDVQLVRDQWIKPTSTSGAHQSLLKFVATPQANGMTGLLVGQSNCSRISGTYQTPLQPPLALHVNAKIRLQACNDRLSDEVDLIDALADVTSYQIVENRLELKNAANNVVIVAITTTAF